MPLETGDFISDLDSSYPLGGDPVNKGDDHLRLIKHVMKTTFPGETGLGFSKTIIATEDEINFLTGVTANVQAQLDDHEARITANEAAIAALETTLPAPAGTRLPFYQAAAPTGWTQVNTTDVNNAMLRVVSTAGGGNGGSDSPILNDKVPSHNHTMNSAGNHSHEPADRTRSFACSGTSQAFFGGTPGFNFSTHNTTSTDGAHTHTINNNSGGSNWTPKYVDMIICSKDA
jgi:hypothetical protein